MNLVFDIETVADIACIRKHYELDPQLDDEAVVQAAKALRAQQGQSLFWPLAWHQVVAISVLLENDSGECTLWSLGEPDDSEAVLLEKFFSGLEKFSPRLVSFNGHKFDLPVLALRALKHGISAPLYWEQGAQRSAWKWDNYQGRFHQRHCDLMEVLTRYHPGGLSLDQACALVGAPGKIDVQGGDVQSLFFQGKIDTIRHYCESDVLNTYLVFLAWCHQSGQMSRTTWQERQEALRDKLLQSTHMHWHDFVASWR